MKNTFFHSYKNYGNGYDNIPSHILVSLSSAQLLNSAASGTIIKNTMNADKYEAINVIIITKGFQR